MSQSKWTPNFSTIGLNTWRRKQTDTSVTEYHPECVFTLCVQDGQAVGGKDLDGVVDLRRHLCIGSSLQTELWWGVSKQSAGQSYLQQQTHTPDTHTHTQVVIEVADVCFHSISNIRYGEMFNFHHLNTRNRASQADSLTLLFVCQLCGIQPESFLESGWCRWSRLWLPAGCRSTDLRRAAGHSNAAVWGRHTHTRARAHALVLNNYQYSSMDWLRLKDKTFEKFRTPFRNNTNLTPF